MSTTRKRFVLSKEEIGPGTQLDGMVATLMGWCRQGGAWTHVAHPPCWDGPPDYSTCGDRVPEMVAWIRNRFRWRGRRPVIDVEWGEDTVCASVWNGTRGVVRGEGVDLPHAIALLVLVVSETPEGK